MQPRDHLDPSTDPSNRDPWSRPTESWPRSAAPAPSPWSSPSDARTTGWLATPPPAGGTVAADPRRRGRGAGGVLGAALLAAVLASGSTFAIVELTLPHAAPSPAASTTPNANVAAQPTGGTTTLQPEDITAVVARAKDSVVTLTSQIATNGGRFGGGTATGIGSGIILTSDGYVLTNRHVVEGSQSLKATLIDGSEHDATVVTVSDSEDLALVKVDATNLKAATIGSSAAIQVGQTAIAIGSPLGTFTETVTKGIVSALDRSITVRDDQTGQPTTLKGLIQTDAAINPGNSGGPLLDGNGSVVGVNTATAGSAEGIGFAIPIKEAQSLVDQARAASVA
jgi:serine protease Do